MIVQVVAARFQCTACGDTARIERHDDAWDREFQPLGAWWVAHLQPRIVLVEVTVDGVPAKWVNR